MNECDVSLNCGSIQGDNKSTYSNVGNTFNISFKEGGYKQVIKPDGTVEIYSFDFIEIESMKYCKYLTQRIIDLEKIIFEKDIIIKSKEDIISILRNEHK
jgi:hypothetical protein